MYVQGVRASWTASQWWVEINKEEELKRTVAKGGKRWGRSGQGYTGNFGEGDDPVVASTTILTPRQTTRTALSE